MRQASRYGEEQLMEALSLLLTADLNLKRGAEARAALEWVTVAPPRCLRRIRAGQPVLA